MFRDARDYQICFLSLFLVLGVSTRDWTLQPVVVGTAILTCLGVQALASAIATRQAPPEHASPAPGSPSAGWGVLRSALITGLSLSLLLRTDHWTIMAFAATIAILSKFILRIQGKHIFNPANAGMIAALCLGQGAWVSPGQWGDLGWYGLLFAGAGGIVLRRVGRWDTSVVFLLSYGGLMLLRDRWLGWSWDVAAHHLMNGSLLLFALFMITDPRSIPDAQGSRMLWSAVLGGLAFGLQTVFLIPSALFWSLFCLAPLTPVLDRLWHAPRFQWQHTAIGESDLNSSLLGKQDVEWGRLP